VTIDTVGYKASGLQPRSLAIFALVCPAGPMIFFSPFILGLLKWPTNPSPVVAALMILLMFAPLVLPFVLTATAEGRPEVKILWGRLWNRNTSRKWVLVSLLLWPAVALVINLIARTTEQHASYPVFSFLGEPWTYFPSAFLGGLLIVFIEEFGWRGYVLPRLQTSWNALTSSIIAGILWAPAHLANWFMPPGDPIRRDSFWLFAAEIILASILYAWLFNNTRGSLVAPILAHTLSNTIGALIGISNSFWMYLDWVLLLAVVIVLILFGPRTFTRQRPDESEKSLGAVRTDSLEPASVRHS
jgi:membrane protease YdiL (CAAX protease family)